MKLTMPVLVIQGERYRDLASIAGELGIPVAPSTILRWVVRYSEEFVRRWAPYELVVGRS